MRRILLILVLLVASAMAFAAPPRWEVATGNVPGIENVAQSQNIDSEQIDVLVRDGYIYVACRRDTPVKVFTILGQLISSQTLPAGTHRLRMAAKGIYILKTDNATRRVTI